MSKDVVPQIVGHGEGFQPVRPMPYEPLRVPDFDKGMIRLADSVTGLVEERERRANERMELVFKQNANALTAKCNALAQEFGQFRGAEADANLEKYRGKIKAAVSESMAQIPDTYSTQYETRISPFADNTLLGMASHADNQRREALDAADKVALDDAASLFASSGDPEQMGRAVAASVDTLRRKGLGHGDALLATRGVVDNMIASRADFMTQQGDYDGAIAVVEGGVTAANGLRTEMSAEAKGSVLAKLTDLKETAWCTDLARSRASEALKGLLHPDGSLDEKAFDASATETVSGLGDTLRSAGVREEKVQIAQRLTQSYMNEKADVVKAQMEEWNQRFATTLTASVTNPEILNSLGAKINEMPNGELKSNATAKIKTVVDELAKSPSPLSWQYQTRMLYAIYQAGGYRDNNGKWQAINSAEELVYAQAEMNLSPKALEAAQALAKGESAGDFKELRNALVSLRGSDTLDAMPHLKYHMRLLHPEGLKGVNAMQLEKELSAYFNSQNAVGVGAMWDSSHKPMSEIGNYSEYRFYRSDVRHLVEQSAAMQLERMGVTGAVQRRLIERIVNDPSMTATFTRVSGMVRNDDRAYAGMSHKAEAYSPGDNYAPERGIGELLRLAIERENATDKKEMVE